MVAQGKIIFRFLSPRLVAKALSALDKSTAVVVSACWLAALVTLIMAIFAVHGAVSSKKEAAEALAAEPVLPEPVNTPMNPHEAQVIMDRLQHQFPDLKFDTDTGQGISIKSNDGAKFHQWITALSYVDTMAPEYRWTLRDFCVGACNSGQELMKAVVSGQRVVFQLPQH